MSMDLMVKVMKLKVGNPVKKLVLLKLADNAGDSGECWPSYQNIADHCEVDKRTVMRHVKALTEDGILRIQYRKGVKGNSSNLFHITLPSDKLSPHSDRVSPPSDPLSPPPSDPLSPRTSHSLEPVNEPVNEPISKFDEFWVMYDKKIGRDKCFSKFKRLSKSEVNDLFAKLPLYIQSTPDKQYRKNPVTWLNGKCWNDEIQTNAKQSLHNLSTQNYTSGEL